MAKKKIVPVISRRSIKRRKTQQQMRAEIERLREAIIMAASRFTDLASIIRSDGGYDNAGFMDASAQRLRDAIAE
jgi:phosphoenolpyruvate-protein kinase (PTS system EI component)